MIGLAQARGVIAELNTTSLGHTPMKYLGSSCEKVELMKLGRTDILPLKRRQRDAASPIETKGVIGQDTFKQKRKAPLNRTSLPPSLSAKTLTVPCLLRGRRAEVNNQECFLDAEMTQLPQHSSSWPPAKGRTRANDMVESKAICFVRFKGTTTKFRER